MFPLIILHNQKRPTSEEVGRRVVVGLGSDPDIQNPANVGHLTEKQRTIMAARKGICVHGVVWTSVWTSFRL